MFCSHILSKPIKSDLCKVINSFSLQGAVAGASGEKIIFAVKETSNKKAINSFSLQRAVAGASGEKIIFAVKETSNKKAIWNKE